MYAGADASAAIRSAGFTHVVWIPDSHLGTWDAALTADFGPNLIRPAREGEAVAIAAGLMLGGATPLVAVQCTGFFEAGDALRNVVHDLKLPLRLLVGVRSHAAWLAGRSGDTCPAFTEPVVRAWQLPCAVVDPERHTADEFAAALREHPSGPSVVLLSE